MKKFKTIVIGIFIFFMHLQCFSLQKAVVIVPVADCVGQPLQNYYDGNIEKIYKEIPISWAGKKNSMYTCPRIHQLLFNEVVTIIDEYNEEVLIELPHMYFEKPFEATHYNRFWTLKKNILSINSFSQRNILSLIPEPLIFERPYKTYSHVIALKLPFYCSQTGQTYSAGTRFIFNELHDNFYTIAFHDFQNNKVVTSNVPAAICYDASTKNNYQKIHDFVSLLRLWALSPQGYIPLVWGGNSFTEWKHNFSCTKKAKLLNDETIEYWQPNQDTAHPFTGFDASGLILRAAQICGLPYFFKNTTTIAKNLRPLHQYEALQEGDLLWFPGGICVVSDLKNNRILAAIGYQFGYGRVVELPLEKIFVNISSYQELTDNYHQQKPIITKKADGSTGREIKQYAFLKLSSLW